MALNKPSNSSWSDDMNIMDFANDDDFKTSWISNSTIKQPWIEIDLTKNTPFNCIVIAESATNVSGYNVEYFHNGKWSLLLKGDNKKRFKFHRFPKVTGSRIRLSIVDFTGLPGVTEIGLYEERL
ncbi:MAG: discoidin domain-containing protein [Chitinophagaceae bacterium]|nr:MAG: discoidin domain-containing protein [Chitinophagaceae bacterium]